MDFWDTKHQTDSADPTYGIMPHRRLEPADLNAEELARARGALAYLKAKIGNDGMRKLLADDLAEVTRRTGEWAANSKGWKSANLKLFAPGPGAAVFRKFFLDMVKYDRELDLRAAHPDHFMNMPVGPKVQVIENVGEDNLPWYIELTFTNDQEKFPEKWDADYSEQLGALIFNADGVQIATAMHEFRDVPEGIELSLTISLPDVAPDALFDGHLRHFAVEFRNWTRMAREQSDKA